MLTSFFCCTYQFSYAESLMPPSIQKQRRRIELKLQFCYEPTRSEDAARITAAVKLDCLESLGLLTAIPWRLFKMIRDNFQTGRPRVIISWVDRSASQIPAISRLPLCVPILLKRPAGFSARQAEVRSTTEGDVRGQWAPNESFPFENNSLQQHFHKGIGSNELLLITYSSFGICPSVQDGCKQTQAV